MRANRLLDNSELLDVLRKRDARKIERRLQRVYGITLEIYDEMLAAQGGVCLICHRAPRNKKLAVDHDHKTKKVRGLLCSRCNWGLGKFNENSAFLQRAADYLRQHGR